MFQRLSSYCLTYFLLSLLFSTTLLCPLFASAEDITLHVNVSSTDNIVTVAIAHTGRDPARNVELTLELDGNLYKQPIADLLQPGEVKKVIQKVSFPQKHGSYPLYSKVHYLNEGERLSLINVGYFHYIKRAELADSFHLADIRIKDTAHTNIKTPPNTQFRLFLPDEIEITAASASGETRSFDLKNSLPQFASNYPIYGVLESGENDSLHRTKIVSARLLSLQMDKADYAFPLWVYLLTAVISFLTITFSFARGELNKSTIPEQQVYLFRWLFSVFVISTALLVFYNGHLVADYLHKILDPRIHQGSRPWFVTQSLINWFYFEGKNYDYFAKFVASPLYLYMVFGNYFVIRYLIRPEPQNDKYWQLMLTACSLLFSFLPKRTLYWHKLSKVGALTLLVKFFYAPLLSSWTINNIVHQYHLTNSLTLTFISIQQYLVALCIFIDVTIFAAGYLTELPQLGNRIKSVEPTLLGWVVCLMCYPPLNEFSFSAFDFPLYAHRAPMSTSIQALAFLLILTLWIFYTWATVALGWKASNLTNRGIVSSGPYAYVRHPAYISKVTLWIISGIVFADANFFYLLGISVVYYLRAWTEERHLSRDPDYKKYKKSVRWMFLPRIF